eukprot:gb/GEZN01011193.1/.p1 GENE.gb/GEZN01011193.1/~~gb/GEZN01011193.1/.p1  ORF type:complete len:330 (-),score=27.45 gb/GEZN01011193.1/:170-1159(-)
MMVTTLFHLFHFTSSAEPKSSPKKEMSLVSPDSSRSDLLGNGAQLSSKKGRITVDLFYPVSVVLIYVYLLRATITAKLQGCSGSETPVVFMNDDIRVPLVMTSLYVVMVLGAQWLMAGREPAQVKEWMVVYNAYQIILNLWMVVEFIKQVNVLDYGLALNEFDATSERQFQMSFLIWVHYANKYVELLDTVFMVVRKKFKQVSFLHTFHHFELIWAWYLVIRIAPGGDAWFGACINSFVHVVMYLYYLLCLLGVEVPVPKASITIIQLLQFCCCMAHSIYIMVYNDRPIGRYLAYAQAFVMITMFVLFGNFTYQTYLRKKLRKSLKDTQ